MMPRRKDGLIPSGVILLHQRRKLKKKVPLKIQKLKSRKKPKLKTSPKNQLKNRPQRLKTRLQ